MEQLHFHVLRAIRAVMSVDAAPFTLVFGGGTALARAHKLVRRMSEDVDFKIVPQAAAPVSRNGLRRELGRLGDKVTTALHDAGFAFDPADKGSLRSQNENRYTVWQLPYDSAGGAGQGLRATIQIELTYSLLRLPPVTLPVSSFVAEAYGRPPEIPALACVSLTQTAAEKLVALTRRTAMELAGLSRDIDPALIRHVYDLHMMKDHIDHNQAVALASEIARTDAAEFRNQYPAYADNLAGETRKALDALRTDPTHARPLCRFHRGDGIWRTNHIWRRHEHGDSSRCAWADVKVPLSKSRKTAVIVMCVKLRTLDRRTVGANHATDGARLLQQFACHVDRQIS